MSLSLYGRLTKYFEEAVASGSLVYTKSTQVTDKVNGINFLYTIAPALKKKPTQESFQEPKTQLPISPWLPPEPALTVDDDYRDDYRIVLNKFAVVPYHFLLITKQFKPQTSPLSPDELMAAYSILHTLIDEDKRRHVGFFNCGPKSGASVPHKHMQFVELAKDFVPFPDELVAVNHDYKEGQRPISDTRASFAHFIVPVPKRKDELTAEELGFRYSTIMSRVLTVLRNNGASTHDVSYNFVFTESWMMAVPRHQECYEGRSINSLGPIGMLLAKSDEDLEFYKSTGPDVILQNLCFPPINLDEQEDQYDY